MEYFNSLYTQLTNYYNHLVNYTFKAMYYYPGEGEIFKIKNNCYIKHPGINLRLNLIRLPDIDNMVGLFYDDVEIKEENLTFEEFDKIYKDKDFYTLYKYSTGVINDVYHTKNIKKGKVFGFIKSPLDDDVYMFKIEEGLIDFEKIFEDYKEL